MISFFFASMVVLTFTGTVSAGSDQTIRTLYPDLVYDDSNTLIGYYFDNQNDWYPNWDYRSGISYNSVDYYINTGVGNLGFQIVCDYGSTGANTSYTSIKFKVLGEGVVTNLYLTDISLQYNAGASNWGTFTYTESVYFEGQSNYYYDDESGNLTSDIPYAYTTDFECCINFKVLCTDHTLMEGQWYNNGYNAGYNAGNTDGYNTGYSEGYNTGYTEGYNQGFSTDSTVTSIFSGILQVALVPINFFLAIFNFEILGINLSGFIRALFTIAITIIIIRTIFGGKGASDS